MVSSLLPVFNRIPLSFERGEGAYLFDADGRRYLDFASGVAVTALGHGHPHLVAALKSAAEKPWHLSNLYEIPEQKRLADRLVANSFADTAFFCNSGAEAVECGIKMIRKYHATRGQAQRYRMIAIQGAFHGRTLATIAAGGQEKYLAGFGPKVEGFDQAPFHRLEALRAAIAPETAGILIEPVQGEGGLRTHSVEYLRALRAIADEFQLLLMFDEVQSGMGRSGKLFAYEQSGIAPDVIALAKGLGGGFPVGACLASERAASGMTAGVHGTTFGGNPLAMSVANAVLDVMLAPGFLDRVTAIGEILHQGLTRVIAAHPTVYEETRGQGLMVGLRCRMPNHDVQRQLRERGLLTVAAGDNVIRLLPPLIIGEAEVQEALTILAETARAWRRQD